VRVAGQPIDRLLATHPYYIPSIIPGGMYVGNPGDVPTIGTRAVLVSSSDQPDEVVYAMVKAVFDNFTVFRQLHPALSTLEIREMVPSASVIPIHPGALKYYREAGLFRQ
jgi:TRAP transporter TAXI family solute receptor